MKVEHWHILCWEPGNIVVVSDIRAMTEVTMICGKSLLVEKRDGARVQLMMRMRGPCRRWAILMFLTLGTLGRISAWTILHLRVMKTTKGGANKERKKHSHDVTVVNGISAEPADV